MKPRRNLFMGLVMEEHLPSESVILAAAGWTVLLSVFAHGMTAKIASSSRY